MTLYEAYRPLATHSGQLGSTPYLLQTGFPLLLANTAFGYQALDRVALEELFASHGAPAAFTLSQTLHETAHETVDAELQSLGYRPENTFSLCRFVGGLDESRKARVEQVPWSQAWNLARVFAVAYQGPQWRYPLAQALGKLLQKPGSLAYLAYQDTKEVGMAVVHEDITTLAAVLPDYQGQGIGQALLGRAQGQNSGLFICIEGLEAEFGGQVQECFVRYALPQ
jgi:GNAT superfamily N-acetyltransferase